MRINVWTPHSRKHWRNFTRNRAAPINDGAEHIEAKRFGGLEKRHNRFLYADLT
jgi:hypothetical protein